jgi:hypothetical protein
MANEVRAHPATLAELAKHTLEASIQLGDGFRGAQAALALPVSAFGDSTVAAGVHASAQAAADDADTAVGRLVAVYEGDVDKLYQTAAAYQRADEESAREMLHRRGGA